MELYDEVDENLITVLGDGEILPYSPKFLCDPTANAADRAKIPYKLPGICHLGREDPREPDLVPRSPLLILIDQTKRDQLGQGRVCLRWEFHLLALSVFLDQKESVVGF